VLCKEQTNKIQKQRVMAWPPDSAPGPCWGLRPIPRL